MSIHALNLMAAVGVLAVLVLVRFLAKRIDHGEMRFDPKTGKQIKDED